MNFDLVGKTIIASDALKGTYFEDAVVLIVLQNEEGTVGLIQNRLYNRDLNELQEFVHSKSFPLLEGGPCEQDALYFIHNRPDLIGQSQRINHSWYWQGDFKKAINLYNEGIDNLVMKIFIGYCGWDRNELESELAEGSWALL